LVANAMRPAKEAKPAISSETMPKPDLGGLSEEELEQIIRGTTPSPSLTSTQIPATPATLPSRQPPKRRRAAQGIPSVRRSQDRERTSAGAQKARAEGARGAVASFAPARCCHRLAGPLLERRGGVMNSEQMGALDARSSAGHPVGRGSACSFTVARMRSTTCFDGRHVPRATTRRLRIFMHRYIARWGNPFHLLPQAAMRRLLTQLASSDPPDQP
jgi:hypothetical protein